MSTFSITAVHLERAPSATHDHIARVKLLDQTRDYARSEIIAAIKRRRPFLHICMSASEGVCPWVPLVRGQ